MEPAWRPTWKVWLALAAIAIALTGTLWYLSDADLAAIDRRAAAMGVPTTWPAFGLVRSDAARIAEWKRLEVLAAAVASYVDAHPANSGQPQAPQPGEPAAPELVAHHASLPGRELAALLELSDRLTDRPLVLHTSFDISMDLTEVDASRRICRLFEERVALAEPLQVADETERMIRLATVHQPMSLIHGLVAISECAMWSRAAARRLHEPGVDRQRLGRQAEHGRRWLATAMPQTWRGEFVFIRTMLHDAVRGADGSPAEYISSAFLNPRLARLGLGRPFVRLTRSSALSLALDQLAGIGGPDDHRHRLDALHRFRSFTPGWLQAHFHRPAAELLDALMMTASAWAKADIGLAVVQAEAHGTAWPIDPMDPTGHPIRRIERDGRLIGYYFVGTNGIDDGASMYHPRDDCVALYERLGNPRASDPLPKAQPLPESIPGTPTGLPPAYYFNP